MSETRSETGSGRERAGAMMRTAKLVVDANRLDELAGLVESAQEAASNLDDAAARVPLSEALAVFDPTWPGEGRRP